jgi:hypothetical protein
MPAGENGKHGMFARRNQRWSCSVATTGTRPVPLQAEGARMRGKGKRWFVLGMFGAVFAFTSACGADDDDVDAGPEGERCASPGYTETGCLCGNGAVGRRTCGANSIWKECSCPPVNEQCAEGRDVQCNPCPGETTGRITKCLQAGTFDCACE